MTWSELCTAVDPHDPDSRRRVRWLLCSVAAVGTLLYFGIEFVLARAGGPATSLDRRFWFIVLCLLAIVPFGRIAELRPVGFFALCGILVLPALSALMQAARFLFDGP